MYIPMGPGTPLLAAAALALMAGLCLRLWWRRGEGMLAAPEWRVAGPWPGLAAWGEDVVLGWRLDGVG